MTYVNEGKECKNDKSNIFCILDNNNIIINNNDNIFKCHIDNLLSKYIVENPFTKTTQNKLITYIETHDDYIISKDNLNYYIMWYIDNIDLFIKFKIPLDKFKQNNVNSTNKNKISSHDILSKKTKINKTKNKIKTLKNKIKNIEIEIKDMYAVETSMLRIQMPSYEMFYDQNNFESMRISSRNELKIINNVLFKILSQKKMNDIVKSYYDYYDDNFENIRLKYNLFTKKYYSNSQNTRNTYYHNNRDHDQFKNFEINYAISKITKYNILYDELKKYETILCWLEEF